MESLWSAVGKAVVELTAAAVPTSAHAFHLHFLIGEDVWWHRDAVCIAFAVMAIAVVHCALHRLLFQPLSVWAIPGRLFVADDKPASVSDSLRNLGNGNKPSLDSPPTTDLITPPDTPPVRRRIVATAARAAAQRPAVSDSIPEDSRDRDDAPPTPPAEVADPVPDADTDVKRRKFAISLFKFLAFGVLFIAEVLAISADDVITRQSVGVGWVARGPISNYVDWPYVRLRHIPIASVPVQSVADHPVTFWAGFLRALSQLPFLDFLDPNVSTVISSQSLPTLFQHVEPNMILESPIVWLFYLAMGHYFYATILTLFNLEGKQKDKAQQLIHHAVTVALICYAWYWKFIRIGSFILLLHDMSDPLMEVAKVMLYTGRQLWANVWFAVFAAVFVCSRCVIFPAVIVWPTILYTYNDDGLAKIQLIPLWWAPIVGLCVLQLLHIFWSALIINMIIDAITKGDVGDDVRDEE